MNTAATATAEAEPLKPPEIFTFLCPGCGCHVPMNEGTLVAGQMKCSECTGGRK